MLCGAQHRGGGGAAIHPTRCGAARDLGAAYVHVHVAAAMFARKRYVRHALDAFSSVTGSAEYFGIPATSDSTSGSGMPTTLEKQHIVDMMGSPRLGAREIFAQRMQMK